MLHVLLTATLWFPATAVATDAPAAAARSGGSLEEELKDLRAANEALRERRETEAKSAKKQKAVAAAAPAPSYAELLQPLKDKLFRIGRMNTSEAVAALVELLPELEEELQRTAVAALAANTDASARPALRALAGHKSAAARGQAVAELCRIDAAERAWLRDERWKREKEDGIRADLLDRLLRAQAPELEELALEAAKAKHKGLAQVGLRGIGELQLRRGFPAVVERLGDADQSVRLAVFKTLADLGGREAYRHLLAAMGDMRNEAVRDQVQLQLDRARSAEEVDMLIKNGLGARDGVVVIAATQAVAVAAEHQAALCGPALLKLLEHADPAVRTVAVEGLVKAKPPGAVAALVDRLEHPDYHVRADAAWGLSLLGGLPPEAETAFIYLAQDERPSVRLHATTALRWFAPAPGAYAALLPRLRDELWSVRSAAIASVLEFRRAETIPALIELLAGERGRVRDEALAALQAHTGEDLGPVAMAWERWWNDRPADWRLPSAADAAAALEQRRRSRAADAAAGGYGSAYHGIQVPAGGVVFIFDVSGSMEEEWTKGETRIAHFSKALAQAIRELSSDVQFNVITFAELARQWQAELVPATEENKQAAAEHLLAARAGGGTNIHHALLTALRFDATQTIFLFTDGEPTVGKLIVPEAILEAITRANRDRRVVIHTIAAGEAAAGFLADLAAATGGNAVDLTRDVQPKR